MSTSEDIGVAVSYSTSRRALVLKLRTDSFLSRGADVSYLSAFPAEKEVVFPPLTFLRPTGRTTEVTRLVDGIEGTITLVEVTPTRCRSGPAASERERVSASEN